MADEENKTDTTVDSETTHAPDTSASSESNADARSAAADAVDAASAETVVSSKEAAGTESGGEAVEADAAPEAHDLASPDAILARVAALDEDDEIERIARAEEAKLEERRKMGALEASASKKLQKIGTKPKKKKLAKEQAELAARERDEEADEDERIERVRLAPRQQEGAVLNEWFKNNQKLVAAAFGAVALGALGYLGIKLSAERTNQAASAILADAIMAEAGRVGDPDSEAEAESNDPRPIFKTAGERRDAALAKYREVETKFGGSPAAVNAQLGEGGLLLDGSDGKGALAAFEAVRNSETAKADDRIMIRALEGLGFAQELLGAPDKAVAAYKDLEAVKMKGARELGLYHQARMAEAKGDKEAAKNLYLKIRETTQATSENLMFAYLGTNVDDRLKAIDPKAIPAKAGLDIGGGLTEAKIKEIQAQIRAKQAQSNEEKEQGHAP